MIRRIGKIKNDVQEVTIIGKEAEGIHSHAIIFKKYIQSIWNEKKALG